MKSHSNVPVQAHSPNLNRKSIAAYIQTGHIGDEETQTRTKEEEEVEEEEEEEELVAVPHQAVQQEEKEQLQIGWLGVSIPLVAISGGPEGDTSPS